MARGLASVARKHAVEDSDEEIDPKDFFGDAEPAKKTKPKPKPKPKAKPAAKAEPNAEKMDVCGPSTAEVGFPASDLPDVAPKKFSFANHAQHMDAKDPGSKELPEGAANCLDGLRFVVTGEFSSLSREGITDLIKTYGGHITSAVSGKTSYLVVGDDPGSSKIKKAKSLKTRCLYEDHLLELIRSSKPAVSDSNAPPAQNKPAELKSDVSFMQVDDYEHQDNGVSSKASGKAKQSTMPEQPPVVQHKDVAQKPRPVVEETAPLNKPASEPSELWTEKYKPTKLKDLCGHKENAKMIIQWLGWWASGTIPEKRAVLISGPPGIGKTTTAHLVAKLAGFDVLELNASETRSKNALSSILGSAVGNRSMLEFDKKRLRQMEADQEKQQENDADLQQALTASGAKKLAVIMDEVDGMSGGDRGGTTELIQLIKRTKVPIICICNDRQSTKVRSLANHCEDIRFRRPTEQQMRARLNTIAFREGLTLGPNAITQLVQSTHNDIRQIINLMSSYALNKASMSYLESKAFSALNKKQVSVGPFDVIGKYLSGSGNAALSFADKLDLYYADYSIIPLFVQENYIDNGRGSSDLDTLDGLSSAADLISESDIVDRKLRGSQQWGLMPLHAALSCVGPALCMRGGRSAMYRFPGWLGQNSKGSRLGRLLQDVQSHMRLRVSADKTEIRKSYVPAMVPELVSPLASQGVGGIPDVIGTMDHYYLTKEHWDAMVELHLDGERLLKQIPSAVKLAFTRQYNKANHPMAYQTLKGVASGKALSDAAASRSVRPDTEEYVGLDDEGDDEGDDEEDSASDDNDVDKDALVKPVKRKAGGGAGGAKASASSSRKRKKN
ncbi:DNA replication factor C complex subunit Rfc1 [Coemansia sp. RSA 1933]|nr:DNA replication factor C complex subunit Rfc1 [Coemansia sp. RSA 1933]